MLEGIVKELEDKLKKPLPGLKAQLKMSPHIQEVKEKYINPREDARQSGVLILLYKDKKGEVRFPLIKRSSYDGAHSGQVSLPGGKMEEGESYEETALREAEEEIGINSKDVHLIGRLSRFYVWVSNFLVQPIVGYINYEPVFVPDLYEVEDVITTSLNDFMDEQKIRRKEINTSRGFVIDAPYFDIGDEVVWGATAMMLSEFKEILKG